MADQEVKVRIITDSSGAVTGFRNLHTEMDKFSSKTTAFASKIKEQWLGLTAAVAGVGMAMSQAWNLAESAAGYIEQMQGLDALAQKYGSTSAEITNKIQSIGDGLISMSTSAQVAYEGIAKGLNPEMLYGLSRAATVLADQMGITVDEAFANLASALETNKEKSLKLAIGNIDLKETYGDLADEMSKSEKQMAFYKLVMEKTDEIEVRLGNSTKSLADQMESLRVSAANLKTELGMGLIRIGAGVVGTFQWISSGATKLMSIFPTLMKWVSQAGAKVYEWTGQTSRMEQARKEAETFAQIAADMDSASQDLAGKGAGNFNLMVSKTEDLVKAQRKASASTDALRTPIKSLSKETDSLLKKWENLRIELEGKISAAGLSDFDQELKKIETHYEKLRKEYSALPASKRTQAMSLIGKAQETDIGALTTKAAQEDYLKLAELEKISRDYQKKIAEEAKKTAAEKLEAERNLYSDLRGYEDSFYAASIALIQSQSEEYRRLKIDEVAIAGWADEEKRKIELKQKRAGFGGTYGEGFSEGVKDWSKNVGNMFAEGEKMAKSTSQAMSSTFSELFFDAARGEMDSFSDYFSKFTDSLLKAFTDMLAEMAAKQMMQSIFGGGSSGGGGGILGSIFGGLSGMSNSGDSVLSDWGGWSIGANGFAMQGGRRLAFAAGGIVTGPTIFPMANGMGLMGEAGPEAIMPLKRTSDGKLGVAGGGTSVTVNVNADVGTKKMIADLRSGIEETVIRVIRRHS